jgi:hypothetical protein
MRAYLVSEYKHPVEVGQVPEPALGDHAVIVEIHAADRDAPGLEHLERFPEDVAALGVEDDEVVTEGERRHIPHS